MEQLQEISHPEVRDWPQILIMEDEESVAKGLEMILNDEGYTVDLAQTGRGALDSIGLKDFDLLIADLRLPDIDGMEVIKQVKFDRPSTEVVVITGYSTVPSAVEAMKLGVRDYLPKPFTEDEFMSVVQDALHVQKNTVAGVEARAVLPEVGPAPLEPLTQDLQKVEELMASFRQTFSGGQEEVIPMLQAVQDSLGYIPEPAMEGIARLTKTPSPAIYGVATFYEQFRLHPVGKHIVKVCRGTACHVKGAERILSEIESRFRITPGQTTQDRKFTLETVACFGSCAIAPVVVVDKMVKGRVNPIKTRKMLEKADLNENRPDSGDAESGK